MYIDELRKLSDEQLIELFKNADKEYDDPDKFDEVTYDIFEILADRYGSEVGWILFDALEENKSR